MSYTYPKLGGKIITIKYLQVLHNSILNIFIFLHIQCGCFFVIDHVIACKKEYRKNSQEGKKTQILVMTAQNEFSIIKHPESCFLVGLNKHKKPKTNILTYGKYVNQIEVTTDLKLNSKKLSSILKFMYLH